jgi:hypothetical protein
MNKAIVKKMLFVATVGGLAVLGLHAQKYIRLFLAFRGKSAATEERTDSDSNDDYLDDLINSGEAVKVRIVSTPDDEDGAAD